ERHGDLDQAGNHPTAGCGQQQHVGRSADQPLISALKMTGDHCQPGNRLAWPPPPSFVAYCSIGPAFPNLTEGSRVRFPCFLMAYSWFANSALNLGRIPL